MEKCTVINLELLTSIVKALDSGFWRGYVATQFRCPYCHALNRVKKRIVHSETCVYAQVVKKIDICKSTKED